LIIIFFGEKSIMARMVGFIAIFLSVYGTVNLYLFVRILEAGPFSKKQKWLIGILIALMTFGPLITRGADHLLPPSIGAMIAYLCFVWMGFVFYFFFLHIAVDLIRFIVLIILLICRRKWQRTPKLYHRIALTVIGIICCGTVIYGLFEATRLTVEQVHLTSGKIPVSAGSIRIIQVSDLHIGVLINQDKIAEVASRIKELEPDILISTGDLLDSDPDNYDAIAATLRNIETRFGKFAVTGNHEYYAGLDISLDFTAACGFKMLRGDSVSIPGTGLTIAGVDDMNRMIAENGASADERIILATIPPEQFVVLLKHKPVVTEETTGSFDLMLSGHTHQGQFYPFNYLVEQVFPYLNGLYELGNGSKLYVNRGTGTWGPPLRVLAPPEITVIELCSG